MIGRKLRVSWRYLQVGSMLATAVCRPVAPSEKGLVAGCGCCADAVPLPLTEKGGVLVRLEREGGRGGWEDDEPCLLRLGGL